MPCASEPNAGEPFGWRWDAARTGEPVVAPRRTTRLHRLGLGLLGGSALGGVALGLGFLGFVDGLARAVPQISAAAGFMVAS